MMVKMCEKKIPNLRVFLYTIIDLISQGISENCKSVENLLKIGIASSLYSAHASYFKQNNFCTEQIPKIDEYFKQWLGVADGCEMSKYGCSESEGLQLIIKLVLNEIC